VAGDDGATEIKLKPFEVLTMTFSENYGLWYVVSNVAKQEILEINRWTNDEPVDVVEGEVWYKPDTASLRIKKGEAWVILNYSYKLYVCIDPESDHLNVAFHYNWANLTPLVVPVADYAKSADMATTDDEMHVFGLHYATKEELTTKTDKLNAVKTDRIILKSVTVAPVIETIDDLYYNAETTLLYHVIDDGGLIWEDTPYGPIAGVIYVCQGSNYMWNGVKLREVGATTDLSLFAKKTELGVLLPSEANPLDTVSQTVIGGINELQSTKSKQSIKMVTDPSTNLQKIADVDLAVNAISAVSAETSGMSVKDRFGHQIDTWYATKAELNGFSLPPGIEALGYAMSDPTSDITAGIKVPCAAIPYNFTLTSIRAQLGKPAIGILKLTIDVKKNGISILTTLLTFDSNETISEGAEAPYVLVAASIPLLISDIVELSVVMAGGIDQAAQNLTLFLIGTKTI